MPTTRRAIWALAALPLWPAVLAGCGSGRATADGGGAQDPPTIATSRPAGTNAAAAPKEQKTTPIAKPKPAAGPIVEATFDTIKFDMPPGDEFRREMITPQIEALAGQRVRIRGYILPTSQKRGIKQFVLVRDNQECCFGPGAALYDCVLVHMQPGRTAEFSIRPVAVEGTFGIEVFYDLDNVARAVYRLDGEAVR